jgi:hypothetical protein
MVALLCLAGCERVQRDAALSPPDTLAAAPAAAPAAPDTDAFYGESPVLHESTTPPPRHGAPAAVVDTGGAGDHIVIAVPFAGRDYADLNAVALVKPNGELRHPRIPAAMPAPSFPFARRWLSPGHAYTLARGGRAAGRVLVSEAPKGCGVQAAGKIQGRPIPMDWAGVATDLDMPAGAPLRRGATAAERREMTSLLRRAVSVHDTALWHGDLGVEVDAVLLPGGATTLAGSAAARSGNAVNSPYWSIFVIADREGTAYVPRITWWQDGDETNPDLLLDAFDLDRDGTPEIFTTTAGDHGHNYTILRHGAGEWKVIFEAGGC